MPPHTLSGARKHLEAGHRTHTSSNVAKYRVPGEQRLIPGSLTEVQAFIQLKFGSMGLLDFQQSSGGLDTSFIQVNNYRQLVRNWAWRHVASSHDVCSLCNALYFVGPVERLIRHLCTFSSGFGFIWETSSRTKRKNNCRFWDWFHLFSVQSRCCAALLRRRNHLNL